MKRLALLVLPLLAMTAHADDVSKVNGSVHVRAGESVEDVSSVNGGVHIDENATAKKVETVNGGIEVGSGSTVESIETVNGGIHLGAGVKAAEVTTVNGGLTLGENSRVAHDVSAVNGSIQLAKGAEVGGELSNTNGKIALDAAHVVGTITTTNGGIDIGANSRVDGGIHVEKPHTNWFGSSSHNKPPRIVIGPNAMVKGTLKFDRPVLLFVSDRATVGKIEGAKPIKFKGDQPSDADERAALAQLD
ncbi:MAG TPA: hypothetical protein VFS24_05710 [Steroidobacteraceae bacterium]|nr:hypothetical protein [Steroidobacteraceae bacterium]